LLCNATAARSKIERRPPVAPRIHCGHPPSEQANITTSWGRRRRATLFLSVPIAGGPQHWTAPASISIVRRLLNFSVAVIHLRPAVPSARNSPRQNHHGDHDIKLQHPSWLRRPSHSSFTAIPSFVAAVQALIHRRSPSKSVWLRLLP
jgi:hypothetical protein